MLEENMDEQLSNFDLKHFCDGNPVYCFYFRLPTLQASVKLSTTKSISKLPKEIPLPKTSVGGISSKIRQRLWQE
jgi:hypothetical protein